MKNSDVSPDPKWCHHRTALYIGPFLALLSAICWSLANVNIQAAARRFGTWGALVWAQVIGAGITAIIAWLVEGGPSLGAAHWPAVALAALAACAAYTGLFESLRLGQVAVVTPIVAAWSVISVAIAAWRFDERLTALGGLGVALVVVGNAVLARRGGGAGAEAGGSPPAAVAWAALAMLGFGVMVPAVDALGEQLGRLWTVPIVWGAELAIGLPLLWRFGRLPRRPQKGSDWWLATRLAIFETGGFVAVSCALGFSPVTVVSPISSLSTAGSVLLGLWLLRERLDRRSLAGALAASAGVVLVNT